MNRPARGLGMLDRGDFQAFRNPRQLVVGRMSKSAYLGRAFPTDSSR